MKSAEQVFGTLSALTISKSEKPKRALVLLHGVGSNEVDLLCVGKEIGHNRLIVSLRAPLVLGPSAFAWFHVQFTAEVPVNKRQEASAALKMIESAIKDLSKTEMKRRKIYLSYGTQDSRLKTQDCQ